MKMEPFWPIKVYIFEMYSSRAFQWYVTWRVMLPIAKDSGEYFLEKKASEAALSREPNMKKPRKNVVFDVG